MRLNESSVLILHLPFRSLLALVGIIALGTSNEKEEGTFDTLIVAMGTSMFDLFLLTGARVNDFG
jgi:hypothetical protein